MRYGPAAVALPGRAFGPFVAMGLLFLAATAGAEARLAGRAKTKPASDPAPSLFAPYTIKSVKSKPEAVAMGDVNGDGRPDVVLTTSNFSGPDDDFMLFVFLQNADGWLDPPVKYPTFPSGVPLSVAIGDVTGDGRADVVVGNASSDVGVFGQNGAGGLDPIVLYATPDSWQVRIADLNHDGRLDVVGLGAGTNTVSVLLQKTDGTLAAPTTYAVDHAGWAALDVGDVNGDGRADIVVLDGGNPRRLRVLRQKSDGSFGRRSSIPSGKPQITLRLGWRWATSVATAGTTS